MIQQMWLLVEHGCFCNYKQVVGSMSQLPWITQSNICGSLSTTAELNHLYLGLSVCEVHHFGSVCELSSFGILSQYRKNGSIILTKLNPRQQINCFRVATIF